MGAVLESADLVLTTMLALAPALPKRTAPVTTAPPNAGAALAEWSDLAWGMTSAQVMALHPDARPLPSRSESEDGACESEDDTLDAGALTFSRTSLEQTFRVAVRFRNGGLYSVTLVAMLGDEAATLALTARLAAALTEKYGSPSGKNRICASIEAVEWRLPTTKIELRRSKVAQAVQLSFTDATGGPPVPGRPKTL